jgi:hypothetical protein
MIRYKAFAPARQTNDHGQQVGDPCYSGKTLGIRFERGVAVFDDLTVSPFIGLTAAEIAQKMQADFGYTVTKIDGETGKPISEKPIEETKAKKKEPQPA